MIFPLEKKEIRVHDDFGYGHYHASRGLRLHNGIDYLATTGSYLLSPMNGTITKIGYAYAGNTAQKYVEITSQDKTITVRIFYIEFASNVGTVVKEGDIIAQVGNISVKYDTATKKMQNHIHIEIKLNGVYQDPEIYFNEAVTETTVANIPKWVGLAIVPGLLYLLYWLTGNQN